MSPRAILFVLGTIIVSSSHCSAQGTPWPTQGLVFDDFDYSSTAWEEERIRDNPSFTGNNGSLFGYNQWHTNYSLSGTQSKRLWYNYTWQEEPRPLRDGDFLDPVNGPTGNITMGFHAPNGRKGTNCNDASVSNKAYHPQIMTGVSSRTGTWTSRLSFDATYDDSVVDIIQAFWLLGAAQTQHTASGDTIKYSDEIDVEWNNSFEDVGSFPYFVRFGHGLNQHEPYQPFTRIEQGGNDGSYKIPFYPNDYESNGELSCKWLYGSYSTNLNEDDCARAMVGQYTDIHGNTAQLPVSIIFNINVDGERIKYSFASHGWGGTIYGQTRASVDDASTLDPLGALYSVYASVPRSVNDKCSQNVYMPAETQMEIDWFYFSPDPTLDYNTVTQHVEQLRNMGTSRITTINSDLERPDDFADGNDVFYHPGDHDTSAINASLDIAFYDLSKATVYADHSNRHGLFKYYWKVKNTYSSGATQTVYPNNRDRSLDLNMGTFICSSTVTVTVSEYSHSGGIINSGVVTPETVSRTVNNPNSCQNLAASLQDSEQSELEAINAGERIALSGGEPGDYSVDVYDSLGRVVLTDTYSGADNEININSLASGFYILVATKQNERHLVHTFVIAR